MKNAESEIRTLFDQYNKRLVMEKKDITDKLTKWGNTLIRRIEDHVAEQKKFLDEHCEKRKRAFEAERKRIIADVTAHNKRNEVDEVERLLAEFRNLKLNLPVLDQNDVLTSHMRVSTEDALPIKESDKNNAQQTKANQFQDTIAEDNKNGSGNSASGSRRSSIKPSSAKNKPPSDESKETATSIEHVPSSSDDVNSKPDVESEDGMLDKCPVCFMMFPQTMEKDDRNVHINEHYGDD